MKENQVYFYNEENWGVEEAYRAFEPNYSTVITKNFLENCTHRVWVVEQTWGDAVQKVFEYTDYKKISEKEFYTKYHDYSYRITLMQKY